MPLEMHRECKDIAKPWARRALKVALAIVSAAIVDRLCGIMVLYITS